jgi:hypothetical protein
VAINRALPENSNDVDVVVAVSSASQCVDILSSLGYNARAALALTSREGFEQLLTSIECVHRFAAPIDLHWAFGPAWAGVGLAVEPILESKVTLKDDGIDWPWMTNGQLWNVQATQVVKSRWAEPKSLDHFVACFALLDRGDAIEAAELAATWMRERDLQLGLLLAEREYGVKLIEPLQKKVRYTGQTERDLDAALKRRARFDPEQLSNRLTFDEAWEIWQRDRGSKLLWQRLIAPQWEDIEAAGVNANDFQIAIAKAKRLLRRAG